MHHGGELFRSAVLEGGGVDFSWNGGHFVDGRAAGRGAKPELVILPRSARCLLQKGQVGRAWVGTVAPVPSS